MGAAPLAELLGVLVLLPPALVGIALVGCALPDVFAEVEEMLLVDGDELFTAKGTWPLVASQNMSRFWMAFCSCGGGARMPLNATRRSRARPALCLSAALWKRLSACEPGYA